MDTKTFYRYGPFLILLFFTLWVVKFFDISYPLTITTTSRSSELAVVGEGKVDVTPDTAYVDAGIAVDNVSSVEVAQKMIDVANNKIIDAMKGLGIKKEDIKTSNYSIFPNYSYEGGKNRINGYNGNVTISIKVVNTSLVSKVIEQATAAGANQVQGARFTIDKPEKYRETAREKAIQNAREQATKLAANLGIRLGKVTNIVESTSDSIPPISYRTEASGLGVGGGGPLIEPGSQTISSVVTLYFEKR